MLVLLLAGCPADDDTTDVSGETGAALCADRVGGALITIQVVDDTFTLWSTDDPFVDAAAAHLAAGTSQVPNFGRVVLGSDCDPRWSWHVDPDEMAWADVTIELCDGTPSYIEQDPETWITQVGAWCPWSAVVTEIDDRR